MSQSKTPSVNQSQVNAFRLARHHLATRLPGGSLLVAPGACGVQNTPPGSAGLSLYARVVPLTPQEVERALYEEKTLLQAWSLRAAPLIFPTAEREIFTTGLQPLDDASISAYTGGVDPALETIGIRPGEVVELCVEALWTALDGRALTKDELGIELARRIELRLCDSQREGWRLPSYYAAGQSLGESVVRFMLPVLSLQGLCCHAERRGNKAYVRRVDQWLREERTPGVRSSANQPRAELLRRYLRCYGPSSVQHFSEWAGIGIGQAKEAWALVQSELAAVRFNGRERWILAEDLAPVSAPPEPAGVRFLPPHDPYLQLRDRENLVADPALRRTVWRTAGSPGVVLVDGQFAGLWRPRKQGKRLKISIQWVIEMPQSNRPQVEMEANGLAAMENCTQVEIQETGSIEK